MTVWCDDVVAHGLIWPNHEQYLLACDKAYQDLILVSNFKEFTFDVPTVICVARNEEQRLPLFIEHYLKLGAKSIHIIDNNSTDKTAEIANSYSYVTLWKTSASYARSAFGQLWVGALARRFGINRWVLNLDTDELLVYDGMDKADLSIIQAWMINAGRERLFTPLIDVYTGSSLKGNHPVNNEMKLFFDGHKHGEAAPYTQKQTPFGSMMTGGPRSRMLASIGETNAPALQKYALARWDSATSYANVHYPYPFERNPRAGDCFAALLHLKLLGDFLTRVHNAVLEREHWNEAFEYQSYQRWLESSQDTHLLSEDYSSEYVGPQSLIAAGIIKPAPWEKFLPE